MGCDIHCYLEYKVANYDWRGFGKRINPGRNYVMFGLLAGVRYDGPPVVEPRGFPDDASYYSRGDNNLYVVDHDTDSEETVSREQAEKWVQSGSSKWVSGNTAPHTFVTHPDWHTHSWLTREEFERAVDQCEARHPEYKEPQYRAIVAALKCFEGYGYQTRVVFWFDN